MRRLLPLAVLVLLSAPLAAQGASGFPFADGDPTVDPDTIYRLALDPAAHPGEASALLLDDGIVRIETDGRVTRTYRQVIQVLTEDAVSNEQEWSFAWHPGHERFHLNWIKVVKPDGTVISAGPAHEQETDVPAEMGDPVYSDRHELRVSLSGVAVGTLVDYSYTTEDFKPFLPGDFYLSWSIANAQTTMRSRYVVDAPAGMKLRIRERNLGFPRQTRVAHGRQVLTWAAHDLARLKAEDFANYDSSTAISHVELASPEGWGDIGRWYAGLARDRYAVTPALAAKVHELVAGARTLDDSIRAVHKYVAQDIRYISIALGISGYRPRLPDSVVATGFGDCKDKATLFVTALRAMGVQADPVLLSSNGHVVTTLPSIDQFDHEIAVVHGAGGPTYTDLTAEYRPYGELPLPEQGEFGLVVHTDGSVEEVRFPMQPPEANADSIRVEGALTADGKFNGWFDQRAVGSNATALRERFATPYDSTDRAKFMRSLATGWFVGARGDSLQIFNGKDFSARPEVRMAILDGTAVERSGDTRYIRFPFGDVSTLSTLADRLESDGPRRFPIDAAEVLGPELDYDEFRVTLPTGWTVDLPPDVRQTSPFGTYESHYAFDHGTLVLTRTTLGARGVYPPSRLPDLTAWLRAVARDNVHFIVVHPPAGTTP